MELNKIVGIGILALFLASCGAPKVMTSFKTDAENFETTGDLTKAVKAWEQYFNEQDFESIEGAVFAKAAKTAFKSGDADLALSWFDHARSKNYADAEMYIALAKIYQSQKNISKELSALEYVADNFKESSAEINGRLFDLYTQLKSYEKAVQVWDGLSVELKNDLNKLDRYFKISKQLENQIICDSVSLVLLEKNPEHVDALEWNAQKMYLKGENRYKSEMAKYEKNKTHRQHRLLREQLDIATADFKKALVYFEKLWEIEPGKKYAGYLANIYTRFGDKKKSEYYQKYL